MEQGVPEQFKALGDPVRWAIVRELLTGSRDPSWLAKAAGVSPPLLSHHLKVLREAGLITATRRGRRIDYSLDEAAITRLMSGFDRE